MNKEQFDYGFDVERTDRGRKCFPNARTRFTEACGNITHEPRYFSHFLFPEADTPTKSGYTGPTYAEWLYWDIDRENDLPAALSATQELVAYLESMDVPDTAMLVFYSGCKGFHVAVNTGVWSPLPGVQFSATAKQFCMEIARRAGVETDPTIYDRVRLLRAPNSSHGKTEVIYDNNGKYMGVITRYKTRIIDIENAELAGILELAKWPQTFELPDVHHNINVELAALWQECERETHKKIYTPSQRGQGVNRQNTGKLRRKTYFYICEGAETGTRNVELFQAAADLRDNGAPEQLAVDLLMPASRVSGLPDMEIVTTITSAFSKKPQTTAPEQEQEG